MGKLEDSLANLKRAISKSKVKKKSIHQEVVSQIASYLVFLKSSVLSQEAASKLSKCLRERLVPVYAAFPQQSLQFTATLCQTIYESKILSDFTAGRHDQKLLWDKTLNALLSGVLDCFEKNQHETFKEVVGSTMYTVLCSIFFSISISHMSIDLRCTGYSILSETSDDHKTNQKRLLDVNVLGGTRLGSILWRTRDFLVLENVLNLFARMIPVTGGTATGKASRSAFIRSVFVESSPDDAETGEKLAKMLEKMPSADWEQTASKIVDVLAASNIAFPQPFEVAEVLACDQTQPTDRLFIDEKGFVANILVGADSCDTLAVAYSVVSGIKISFCETARGQGSCDSLVVVTLDSLPILGKDPITPRVCGQTDSMATVSFSLKNDDMTRFRQALKSRGLDHLLKVNKDKLSIGASVTSLEMNSTGELVGREELAQRIDNLSQLYGTNDNGDDVLEANCSEPSAEPDLPDTSHHEQIHRQDASGSTHALSAQSEKSSNAAKSLSVCDTSAAASGVDNASAVLLELSVPFVEVSGHMLPAESPTESPVTPLQRTKSQLLRDSAFGASDEELSDVQVIPQSPKKPKSAAETTGKKPRPRPCARMIIDSDDEVPNSTPSRAPVKKTVKKAIDLSDADDIEEVLPESNISSALHRRRSTLVMTPVIDATQQRITRSVSAQKNAIVRALSAGPAAAAKNEMPIGQAGPLATSVDLFTQATCGIVNLGDEIISRPSGVSMLSGLDAIPSHETMRKEAEQPFEVLDEVRVDSASSPALPTKAGQKSIKAGLRTKDGTVADIKRLPSHVERPKRKRSLNPELEDTVASAAEDLESPKAAKRRKGHSEIESKDPGTTSRSSALVAGRSGALKRYGGKKGRTPPLVAPKRSEPTCDSIPGGGHPLEVPQPVNKEPAHLKAHADDSLVWRQTESASVKEDSSKLTTPRVLRTRAGKFAVKSDDCVQKPSNAQVKPKARVKISKKVQSDIITDIQEVHEPRTVPEVATDAVLDVRESTPQDQGIETAAQELGGIEFNEIRKQHASTPKAKVAAATKKSNKKPWNDLLDAKETGEGHGTKPEKHTQIRPVIVPKESLVPNVSAMALSAAMVVDDAPVKPTSLEATCDEAELTFVNSPVLAKPTEICKEYQKTPVGASIVDPTQDSPRNHSRRVVSVKTAVRRAMSDTAPDDDEVIVPVKLEKARDSRSVAFALDAGMASSKTLKLGSKARLREVTPPQAVKKPANSASLEDIARVLNEIQEAILHKIHSKVEGVREEVRVGRNQLMDDATSDLMHMRAESIDRYNLLIQLEAEYATFGRELTYGFDDIQKVNDRISEELEEIIRGHSRATIPKNAPGSLFGASLPVSISNLRGDV